ncbi:flagellar biosynthetic protein FliO [Massilia sp. BHUDP2]|uniref:flagellar biosynthetic protein FliO n=1 Tax=Massilia sp. BHUDP2 TaxID=3034505 RepID=UPI003906BE84
MTSSNVAHRIRPLAAALLFTPLAACAAPVGADQATQQQQAAPATQQAAPPSQAAAPAATAPVPVPATASQDTQPLPRGATTTGRPATPARPAPSGPVSTPVQSPGPAPADSVPAAAAEQPATAPAPAATTPTPAQRPPQVVMPTPSAPATGSLLQTILALMLVLGLLLGLAWFMKRFGARVMGASANVKLVGALNIGGRERIMVVEVGNQWIVVGASPGRVNALATMPRQEGAQEDGATLAPHAASAGSFGDWLKNTIDKRNAK